MIYRLCVLASGSLIIVRLKFFTSTSVTCLHLGQNKGKFFNSVSSLICTLVLLLQTGQCINSTCAESFILTTPNLLPKIVQLIHLKFCFISIFMQRKSIIEHFVENAISLNETIFDIKFNRRLIYIHDKEP